MFRFPDKITIWNVVATDGFGGKTYEGPFNPASRNALKQEKFTDSNGDQQISIGVSYSKDTNLRIDSKIFFGTSVSATPEIDSHDVRAISETPSGIAGLKKVWLM